MPRGYRVIRWFSRQLCSTWFRSHGVVSEELIPEKGGVLFAAWHPGALIDPLLMLAVLPGQLTFVAKHTLFKVPLLGTIMRAAGARPVYRKQDLPNNSKSELEGGSGKNSQPILSSKGIKKIEPVLSVESAEKSRQSLSTEVGKNSQPILASEGEKKGQPILSAEGGKLFAEMAEKPRVSGNESLIETLSDVLAEGGQAAIYPEGISHLMSRPQKTKTGPARIMLKALRKAEEAGSEKPVLQPVGLHYTDANKFRERALVTVHQPMALPPLPGCEGAPIPGEELVLEHGATDAADRAWVLHVTGMLGTELDRTSQGLDSWEDRKLLWRARGLLSVHKNRGVGRRKAATYSEAVMGARRARAAWLWLEDSSPDEAKKLKNKVSNHATRMDKFGLREHELYDRVKRPGLASLAGSFAQIIWSWVWMLGLITWGALIGSWPPYRISGPIAHRLSLKDRQALGTHKLAVNFLLMPFWWILISFPVAFLLAASGSPLWNVNLYGLLPILKPYLTSINWVVLAIILIPLWPVAARLHLKLYRRSAKAIGKLKLWKRLRDDSIPWDELLEEQRSLAEQLDEIGQSLVLPGDSDWQDPKSGIDDYSQVVQRALEQ